MNTGRFQEENMPAQPNAQRHLIEKINTLPPEKVAEVEDFVDFLRQRIDDRQLTQAAMKLSENSFKSVWDNPDDAAYDNL